MRDPKFIGVIDNTTFNTVSLGAAVEDTFPANANRKQIILYLPLGSNPVEFGYDTLGYAYLLTAGNTKELNTTCELFLISDLGADILITEVM